MDTPAVSSPSVPQTEPLAIISFVLSLCGWFGFAFFGWIPAIVCGHIARSKIRAGNLQGDSFAVAGLVISYIGLALVAVGIVIFLGFFAVAVRHEVPQMQQIHLPSHP
ncbi:MAG: DUF4190 domain-containing protein [Chthoniobacteraceae bacterium]